jgi:hypothetical protein
MVSRGQVLGRGGDSAVAVARIIRLVDDLDGGPAAETVRFGLDGAGYELDLSTANATALRALLGRYVTAARRVGAGPPRRVRPVPAAAGRPVERPVERPVAAAVGRSDDGQVQRVEPERPAAERDGRPPPVTVLFSDRHANGTANG